MSNSYDVKSGTVLISQCCTCGAEVEGDPQCGRLETDMNRFPDGGWVRIETYTPHRGFKALRVVDVNPFAATLAKNS